MAETLTSRLRRAWNTFMNRDPTYDIYYGEAGYSYRPDRLRFTRNNDRSMMNFVLNRIAVDAASIDIRHVRLDKSDRYEADIDDGLNQCLRVSANLDQSGRMFRADIFATMMDEGCAAIVPVDTSENPITTESYDIYSMRVGRVVEWKPSSVKVNLYNEKTGRREDIWVPKSCTAIVENPFYSIMNEPNSTVQRLLRKLRLLDAVDEQSGSGKLDLIIQLPYVVRSEAKKKQAEERKNDLESQLNDSKYGVAYTDATEKVIQLNRPLENNLMTQIKYLTELFFSQLGITQGIMDGTADETTMLNYNTRIVEPLVSAAVDEMKRKFLSKTARTQKQSVMFFRDPFKLVPVTAIAEISDKFTRNEIMSSNEIRQSIGIIPSKDPKADELRNKNLSQPVSEVMKNKVNSNIAVEETNKNKNEED